MKKLLKPALALAALMAVSSFGVAQRTALSELKPDPALQVQTKIATLPCCECVGKQTQIDISTGQSAPVDPLWQVNGTSAYTTPPYPGWATTLSPAKWIQPVSSPTPSPGVPAAFFKYTLQFTIPKCVVPNDVSIVGNFAADNGAKVSLDGNPVASCPTPYCFKTPAQPLSIQGIGPGSHTLTFEVQNEGGPSGFIVNAKLTRQCRKD
jgi:hypothetical protein